MKKSGRLRVRHRRLFLTSKQRVRLRRGMAKRNKSRPGDLLFYRVTPQSSWVSRVIATFQMWIGDGTGPLLYSHVALVDVVDPDYLIDAWWPRVRRKRVNWMDPDLEVWRIRDITDFHISIMSGTAMGMVGQWYDVGNFFFGLFDSHHAQICTTLVVGSAHAAGIDLVSDAGRLVTPNELVASPMLYKVG